MDHAEDTPGCNGQCDNVTLRGMEALEGRTALCSCLSDGHS